MLTMNDLTYVMLQSKKLGQFRFCSMKEVSMQNISFV